MKQKPPYRGSPTTAGEYVRGILAGNRVLLSRAITLVESEHAGHQVLAAEVLDGCLPHTGGAFRIGITGTPGAGKSTFIEALGRRLLEEGRRVAVLAVDPSSSLSSGSILGDKTRMPVLATHANAFVRPSPAGQTLGGVAARSREVILLCEAAGFDTIFVETVGVGQSETAVHGMVDFFLLLMQASAGDELQGIKRGIVEMADLIAINKADGPLRPIAENTRSEYSRALRLFPSKPGGWTPTALTCSALEGHGLDAIWQRCLDFYRQMQENHRLEQSRREQLAAWFHEAVAGTLRQRYFARNDVARMLPLLEEEVKAGRLSVPKALQKLPDL